MAKLHRDLKDIPTVRLNDPEYKEAKKQLGKDAIYGHSMAYEHEHVTKHNTKTYRLARRKATGKIPTVHKRGETKTVTRLTKSQYVCVEAYRKLKRKHSHITRDILVYYSTAQTVKSLVKKGILEEYTIQSQSCLRFPDKPLNLTKRVGKIQVRMIT